MALRLPNNTSLPPQCKLSTESLPASPPSYTTHFQDIRLPCPQLSDDHVPITTSHRTGATSSAQSSHGVSQKSRVRFVLDPSHRERRDSIDSDFSNGSITVVYDKGGETRRGPDALRRIRLICQVMSSLFNSRKENAGVLNRDAVAVKPTKKKSLFSRVAKDAKDNDGLLPETGKGKPSLTRAPSLFSIRSQTSSVPTKKPLKSGSTTRPIISSPRRLGSHLNQHAINDVYPEDDSATFMH
ncbi:hypothetical protein Moror_16605 [Moniliophthora roreri MCA 2997]|uniref:Uncharacterized protein n=1 Tax=Moniliophthora roreri (strain MCA 2997) TaxID=1381753 RepID=V2WHE5_MONRO|nr:hypothetical protein Moror_16605 [Moniliophthora roreri MCA 2997]